jgi:small subunit ribosomal protein S7
MPRKGAPKRPVVVDPVYGSPLVTQLVNKILLDGKKSIAESIVYGALEGCREKTGTDPVVTLKRALDNVKPSPRGQEPPRRWRDLPGADRGQAGRATTLALRWLVGYSRAASREDDDRAPDERDPRRQQRPGRRVKRREDTHKMAESNKAFAHYRW